MKNFYKYILSIIFSIIEIIIAWVILDNSSYSNDSNVMAGLVIIYATIRQIGISLGIGIDRMVFALANDLLKIKERIRKDYETDEEWEELKIGNENMSTTNWKLTIRSVGVLIILVMGLISLLG